MNLVGQKVLVINSNKVASDLLDRRGNIYSDRPRLISMYCSNSFPPHPSERSSAGECAVAGEIFTGGLIIFLVRFGEV